MRVAQLAHQHDLAAKPRDYLVVVGHVGVQELDRDLAAGRQLHGAVHRADPPRADLRLDLEPIAEHLAEVLFLGLGARTASRALWVLRRARPRRLHPLGRITRGGVARLAVAALGDRRRSDRSAAGRQPIAAHAAAPGIRLDQRVARRAVHVRGNPRGVRRRWVSSPITPSWLDGTIASTTAGSCVVRGRRYRYHRHGVKMSAERLSYSIERERHERFVGRDALLARLDHLLLGATGDRVVVVTGGPGMGKSALLAAWLARREQAGDAVPHHFIRRGQYNWDDPAAIVDSLVSQIADRFPGGPEATGPRMHPAARLAATLARVSSTELVPHGARLVVMIDSLDEYDPPAAVAPGDPLAEFLPHALPRGVSLLCACRPRHLYVAALAARGVLVQIDLDEGDLAADNEATVRAFWDRAAPELALDATFIASAVTRAGGNLQHAALLRQHLEGLAPAQRRVEDIPRGLTALLDRTWERIAADAVAVEGLGILCAAREALTLDELSTVAGWSDVARRRSFLRGARELLVANDRGDGHDEYRLHHELIRAHISHAIGATALHEHHRALAHRLATWPLPAEPAARRYALRHALVHHAEAGDSTELWRVAADARFMATRCRELSVHDVEADVLRAAERCRARGDDAMWRRLGELARALARESHWLRAAPDATAALMWNRLRRSGWSAAVADQELGVAGIQTFLRVRHVATRESPALERDLVGHAASVLACALTANGVRAASASADGTMKVWDTATGYVLATLEGHTSWVMACALTADGRRMISGSADGTVNLWDTAAWRILATLEAHTGPVRACAVTADGRRIVSGSADGTVNIWDAVDESARARTSEREAAEDPRDRIRDDGPREYALRVTLEGHVAPVLACAVTPDGARVVSASEDRTLKVWDPMTGHALATLEGHAGAVRSCAVTADGTRIVSASVDRTLKIWDPAAGRVLTTLNGHSAAVRACAMTADGERVVSASEDRTLKVWDPTTGHALATLQGHSAAVRACAVTADGRRTISASADGTLKVWDTADAGLLAAAHGLEGHAAAVRALAVTPDGRRILSASLDGTLKIWDPATGRSLATLEGHSAAVRGCAVTADGRVISASMDGTLKIWDPVTSRSLATLEGHSAAVRACAVTADGRVISASEDCTLKIWDAATARSVVTLRGHSGPVVACAMVAGGKQVVSASTDGTLKVWDTGTGHVFATLGSHSSQVLALALTGDGRVVSASADGTLKIWALDGRLIATLRGHSGWVLACAVTMDGRRVVSASDDRTLRVWEVASGRALATLEGHAGQVHTCVLTADSRHAISVSEDWTLKVWDLETYRCSFTHRGDTEFLTVAATTSGIAAGDARGAMWFLDLPPVAPSTTQRRAGSDPAGSAVRSEDYSAQTVDVGILTIRDDEFRAVLDAFPNKAGAGVYQGARRQYILRYAEIATGEHYTVAILRHIEQGTGEAQHAARDLIDDLRPRLVLVVGIAGGLPSDDVTLGDIVLGTRIHDYTVQMIAVGHETTYAATGGPIDHAIAAAVAMLPGREDELGDWTSGLPLPPAVTWAKRGQLYGPPEWQRELRAKLEHHHGKRAQ
ncbi:MAG TPA: AAA family ATPase, partial [Kofleriaceae bacterium]